MPDRASVWLPDRATALMPTGLYDDQAPQGSVRDTARRPAPPGVGVQSGSPGARSAFHLECLATSSTVRWERTRTKPVAEVPKLMAAAVTLLPDQSDGVKTYHHRSETTHNNHKKLIRIASSTEHASSKSSQNTKK